ncbi:MAG: hypothetical protein AB1505_07980 [Candidatus Latescibacterota bacterium]
MAELRPSHPDLEQLRKQAKDLVKAHRAADLGAARRIQSHLRQHSRLSEHEILQQPFCLRQAQQVIAREQGFRTWQELRDSAMDAVTRFQNALASQALRYGFSTPEEVEAVIGKLDSSEHRPDGGMEIALHRHGPMELTYGRFREWGSQPFVLLSAGGRPRGIRGPSGPLELRDADDLGRLNPFTGLRGVDASAADMRDLLDVLEKLDSLVKSLSSGVPVRAAWCYL